MQEIVLVQPSVLDFDIESASKTLEEQIAPYKNVVFTEDTKKEAKECVANLRKEQKNYDTALKNLKSEYMKPFEALAEQVHQLMAKYDEPISNITNQINEFEIQRKAEKQEQIKGYYAELVPEPWIVEIIPLDKIYNPKWENATATQKSIKEEILSRKLNAKSAIETIKGFHSDKEDEAIAKYKQSLDLTACITFLTQYEQQKAEILRAQAEAQAKADEERIRKEERANVEQEKKQAEEIEQAVAQTIEAFIPEESNEEAVEYSYSIKLTKDAKEKLEMFMDSIGIEYVELDF